MIQVLTAVTSNSSSDTHVWPGGTGTFAIAGTFDTSTTTLQFSPDDGTTWFDYASGATAKAFQSFTLPPCEIRATVSSVGGSTSIDAWVGKVTPTVR